MTVISIANAKGGAGKTTAALLLAMEFARNGETVTVLDCDPMTFAAHWHASSRGVEGLFVRSDVTSANLISHLRSLHLRGPVIIDLSGARDVLIALAAGLSDLCLIPVQGCAMDAKGATHVLDLIHHVETNAKSRINHAVMLTRVNSLVTTRAMRSVKEMLLRRNVALIDTPLVERSAYRDIFDAGSSLYSMDENKVSNLLKAQKNIQSLAHDVKWALNQSPFQTSAAPFARVCYQSNTGSSPLAFPEKAPSYTRRWEAGSPA